MLITRSTVIARPLDDVFAFVSDPRNDPSWCRKVLSVEQVGGNEPGIGTRYAVRHRPIPLRPIRAMELTCTAWEAPHRVVWREDDGTDVFVVTYELEDLRGSTRFSQRSEVAAGAPRVLHPFLRIGIDRDVAGQLRALKNRLEQPAPSR